MERLTKYESIAGHAHAIPTTDVDKAITKLAEYEDFEEQGLLLRLPCKVGDKIYVIESGGRILGWEIVGIGTDGKRIMLTDFLDYEYIADDIGKVVFLTREEAEAKLKELEGE